MKFGLSDGVRASLCRVFARFDEIERVVVFGSRAKGNFRDASDIDIAVFAPDMTDERFAQLWSALDDVPMVFKIDVLHWERLSHVALKENIVKHGQDFMF